MRPRRARPGRRPAFRLVTRARAMGAVAAMAAYGQALADPRVQLDDRRRRAVAAAVGTERYARSLQDAEAVFAARRSGAVGQALRPGARAVFLAVPVAFRVVSYDEHEAVIRSWGVAIVASDTGLQPRASWGMTTTTARVAARRLEGRARRLAARAGASGTGHTVARRRRSSTRSRAWARCAMRPSFCCLAVVLAAIAVGASAPPASATPGPCDVVGIPFVPDPAEKACEKVTGAVGDVAGDVVGDAAKAVAAPIFRQATEWVAQGAGWLVGRVGALIDTTTTPRLESRWFAGQYAQMALLATALALPLLFLAVIQAALARNPMLITRALAAVPVAFVLTGGAVALVAALLGITDWACQAISGQTGPDSREFFHDVATAFSKITEDGGPTGAAPALFVALLASMFAALAALAVWVELLIRSAGIYVCVLFFPIVLVARIWPKLEKWATRLAEALTALILSKFVIVAVLSVAGAAMAGSRASEGFNGVLAAGALLVFAAFAPLVLFRLVQFADPQVHARAGSAGTVARTGQTTMSAAQAARMSMDRQSAGGGLPHGRSCRDGPRQRRQRRRHATRPRVRRVGQRVRKRHERPTGLAGPAGRPRVWRAQPPAAQPPKRRALPAVGVPRPAMALRSRQRAERHGVCRRAAAVARQGRSAGRAPSSGQRSAPGGSWSAEAAPSGSWRGA